MTITNELLKEMVAEIKGLRGDVDQMRQQRNTRLRPELIVKGLQKFAELYPNTGSEASHRWNHHKRMTNGLDEYGAIVKRGRHLYVNVPRYLAFLAGMPPDTLVDIPPPDVRTGEEQAMAGDTAPILQSVSQIAPR